MPSQPPTSRRAPRCRGRRYYRVRLQFRPARPPRWRLLTPSVEGASGRGRMRRPVLSARWPLMPLQLPTSRVLRVAVARAITGCVASFDRLGRSRSACRGRVEGGCELLCPAVTPGSVNSGAADAFERPSSKPAASCRGPRYYRVRCRARLMIRALARQPYNRCSPPLHKPNRRRNW